MQLICNINPLKNVLDMNFIIEILPKKENGNEFAWVVRAQNGFPIAVCDSLEGAKVIIEEKFNEMRNTLNKDKC